MAPPSSRFQARPTRPEDAAPLNELYLRITGRTRSLDTWRWEWLEGPLGPAPSWVILDEREGALVGHHGVVPVPLSVRGRPVRAARTENSMLVPELRTEVNYAAFERRFRRELEGRFEVLFTSAGKGAPAAVRRRLGYRPVAAWEELRVADTPAHWAARELGAVGRGARFLAPLTLARPPAGWTLEPTSDTGRVAALWKRCAPKFGVALDRTADYLDWRLRRHPYHDYRLAVVQRDGCDVGAVAWWEQARRGGAARVWIEDVFVEGHDEPGYRALLSLFAWRLRDRPVRVQLRTLGVDRPLRRAALSLPRGWLARPPTVDESWFLVSGDVLGDEPWDACMGLDQGLHGVPLDDPGTVRSTA